MNTASHATPDSSPAVLLNARLVCPSTGREEIGGLRIADGLIADIGRHVAAGEGAAVFDCQGHVLAPGLIDMQVSTGEPGEEHRETLATAARAAAAGGVTSIVTLPDTKPAIDDVSLVDFIEQRARDTARVRVYPMAAMTKGLAGKEMSEIGLLKAAGAIAFTDGTRSVANARVMRNILSYARDFGALIVHFTEDPDLSAGGAMNEGEVSCSLGLPGIPCAAETIMLERDVRLVALTGGRYHAAAISCEASLDVVRKAKIAGHAVTCGVTINHLTLNETDIGSYRTYCKMKPPLRTEDERLAMVEGVRRGDIDVIVSGHDPQDVEMKRRPLCEAADGALGLETMLAAALQLYHNGAIMLSPLLAAMTSRPAALLDLPSGRLAVGAPADLVLIDLEMPWRVDVNRLRSKSRNSPFDEKVMRGRAVRTWVGGRCVYAYAPEGATA